LCLQHSCPAPSFRFALLRSFLSSTLAPLAGGSPHNVRKPFRYTSLFAAIFPTLAHGCLTCAFFFSYPQLVCNLKNNLVIRLSLTFYIFVIVFFICQFNIKYYHIFILLT
jgi:hypothetical protein